jgi:leader peptidase (prepilin peptidase)/N-methyltransferase
MTSTTVAVAAFGLLLGPLLNLLADRVPDRRPLRGDGWPPTDRRFWAITVATGSTWAFIAAAFGATWELPAYLYLAAVSVVLAAIDLAVKRLPNAVVLPSYPIAGVLLLLPAALQPDWDSYLRAWLGAVALFGVYFLLALAYPAGMGFGDVKLAGVLGLYLAFLGWGPLIVGAFLGFLLGAVVGGGLVLLRRAQLKTTYPFGPNMLAGALIAVVWGQAITDWYLGAAGG